MCHYKFLFIYLFIYLFINYNLFNINFVYFSLDYCWQPVFSLRVRQVFIGECEYKRVLCPFLALIPSCLKSLNMHLSAWTEFK